MWFLFLSTGSRRAVQSSERVLADRKLRLRVVQPGVAVFRDSEHQHVSRLCRAEQQQSQQHSVQLQRVVRVGPRYELFPPRLVTKTVKNCKNGRSRTSLINNVDNPLKDSDIVSKNINAYCDKLWTITGFITYPLCDVFNASCDDNATVIPPIDGSLLFPKYLWIFLHKMSFLSIKMFTVKSLILFRVKCTVYIK